MLFRSPPPTPDTGASGFRVEVGAAPPPEPDTTGLRPIQTGAASVPSPTQSSPSPPNASRSAHPPSPPLAQPLQQLLPATLTPARTRTSGPGLSQRDHLSSPAVPTSPLQTLSTSTPPTARTRTPSSSPSSHLSPPAGSHLLSSIHPSRPDAPTTSRPCFPQPPPPAQGLLPLTSFPSSSSSHSAFIPTRRKHQLRPPARSPVTNEPGSSIAHSALGRRQHRARPPPGFPPPLSFVAGAIPKQQTEAIATRSRSM